MTGIAVPTTYTVSCSGLKKRKCFMPFCTAHKLRHILLCFVITEKIFIILSNNFIFKSSLCYTSCTVRLGTKSVKVKEPLVFGTLENKKQFHMQITLGNTHTVTYFNRSDITGK